jgi:hypothetical protein
VKKCQGIPEHLWCGLERYLEHRLEPGGFLRAVLENDLSTAIRRADNESMSALKSIVIYLVNNGGDKWGSKELVHRWLKR